ncbi:MAG: hypothetical protein HQ567_28490 [Candidatus Nealsonbacteria bacterium]|nr:hypothetical protein [Candidatus Nealsonbacteria bacterium]
MPDAATPKKTVSRWRRLFFRGITLMFAGVVACLLGEVALRVAGYDRTYVNPIQSFHQFDATLGHRGKPNFKGRFHQREFDVIVEHDKLGFRRQQYQNPREPGRSAVFVFGDSFTWGWGVGQGKVYTDRMSRLVPDVHVRNFGLSGSGTTQQFRIFDTYVRQDLRPGDVVLLAFFRNDFTDNVFGRLPATIRDGQVRVPASQQPWGHDLKNTLKDHSHLFNLAAYCVDRAKLQRKQARAENPAQKGRPLPQDGPQSLIARHFLAEFQKACREKRARLVVAYIPGQTELDEASTDVQERLQFDRVHRQAFFACAESLEIETIDLLPHLLAVKQAEEFPRLTFANDEHWNEDGHAAAGEVLTRLLFDKGQVEVASRR